MYVVVSWLIIQIVATVEAPLSLPDWIDTLVTVLLAVGFPLHCYLLVELWQQHLVHS